MSGLLQNSEFFGAALTIISFEIALALRRRFNNPLVNPFLISVLIIVGVLTAFGMGYESYSSSAQHLSFLVTPATVCLAIPLYRQLRALRENFAALILGIGSGVLVNAVFIFAVAKFLQLSHVDYVSLLPKSITTPIGMALSSEYGGIEAMTILAILVTGISGNVMGEWLMRKVRVRHAVSRGLAMGASAHAIGTARAMEMGETEGAMSGLAIAVTGLLTVAAMPLFSHLI